MNEFMLNPTRIDRPRSVFPLKFRAPTTMKVGEITPLMLKEVLPGDTWSFDLSSVITAFSPFVSRVYGDLFLDVYAFFVPNRLVWDHWQQFCGENDTGAWTQTRQYTIPMTDYSSDSGHGGIGDHMGLPCDIPNQVVGVSELPLRGYYRIYNEWFRNENTDSPVPVTYGDAAQADYSYEDPLLDACRFADYFSEGLPGPQKGGAVSIPLVGNANVVSSDSFHDMMGPMALSNKTIGDGVSIRTSGVNIVGSSSSPSVGNLTGFNNVSDRTVQFTNMVADLSNVTAATINQWRLAFQTQKYLELMARGGSRYIESLKSLFGVTNGDARLQRTEYLGGKRIPLTFQEVVATSSSADNSATQYALGQQVVKSVTHDVSSICTKSFTEHGFLHVYGVIRAKHQYCQGLERMWTRKDFLDFYNPVFDSIGETPIYNKEIYCSGDETQDNQVFAYQEAWADYRYDPDKVTGLLRPNVPNSLSTFTFADKFDRLPTLNGFMHETRSNVVRTFALQNQPADFICDFFFMGKKVRPMSVRSIPGLIDHH